MSNTLYGKTPASEYLYGVFRDYWALGVALTVGTATFLSSFDRLRSQFDGTVRGAFAIAALIAAVYWLLDFLNATRNEIEILHDQGILDQAEVDPWQAIALATLLSVSLGGLIASIPNAVAFCLIAIGVQLVDCIGLTLVQRNIYVVVRKNPNINSIFPTYYLYKPHFLHRIAKLLGFVLALLLAVIGRFKHDYRYAEVSWIVAFVAIISAEAVLAVWRQQLHRALSSMVSSDMKRI